MASIGERLLLSRRVSQIPAARCWLIAACVGACAGVLLHTCLLTLTAFAAERVSAWSFLSSLGVALIVAAVAVRGLACKVDALLFSPLDRRVLVPIQRCTGLLGFCLLEHGPQRQAWDRLRDWATSSVGSNAAASVCAARGEFEWTALIGPSGIGKSQLARELARHLAQRDRYGDAEVPEGGGVRLRVARLRVARMLRRLLPPLVSGVEPFDVGLLAYDELERGGCGSAQALAQFRPRAPTLLLLDTPGLGVVGQAVAILRAAESQYRFPVRLLIIDHEIGMDWPLVPKVDGSFVYSERGGAFEPVRLAREPFDLGWFARACQRRWHQPPGDAPVLKTLADVTALRQRQDVSALHGLLGGDAVHLSLAVHWLAQDPSRSVAALQRAALSRQRSDPRDSELPLAGHARIQLTSDLSLGLHGALRSLEGFDSAGGLACALASATLAQGLPLTREVRTLFAVSGRADRHRSWLQSRAHDSALWLPGISTRPLAEAFVELVREREFSRSPDLFHRQVVQCALDLRPASTLRTLLRGGAMARVVADVLECRSEPSAPGMHLAHFYGAVAAALGGEERMLIRAQCLAGTLTEAQLGPAVTSLERARFCLDRVEPLCLGAVYAVLAQRILSAREARVEAYDATLHCMRRFLHAVSANGLLHYADEHTLKLLLSAFTQFVRTCLNWAQGDRCVSSFEALRKLDDEMICRLPSELLQPAHAVAEEVLLASERPSILSAWVGLWRVRSAAAAARVFPTEQALRGLLRELSEAPLSLRQTVLLRMKAQLSWLGLLPQVNATHKVEGTVAEVEVMAELFAAAPVAYPELTLERARALAELACHRRHGGQAAATLEVVVEDMERLVQGFSADAPVFCELMLNLARVRCHAAAVCARSPEQRARTIDHVEGVLRVVARVSVAHRLYPELLVVAVEAWTHACSTRHGQETYWRFLREAARVVSRLLSPVKATPWAYPQLMNRWASLFIALPEFSPGSESAAVMDAVEACNRKVERILKPFLSRPLVFPDAVERRVAGLAHVVAVRAAGQPADPALDATLVEMLGCLQPFASRGIDHPRVRLLVVGALRRAVQARAQVPELQDRVAPAVQQIGRLVQESGTGPVTSPELVREWALAGASLAYVGGQQEAGTRLSELGARVVQRAIERLGGPELSGEALVQLWVEALQWVAVACSREPGQRGHALQAAQQIDRIARVRLGGAAADAYVLPRARAWAAVAAARRFVTEQRLRTEDAAWKVEALAEPRSFAWDAHGELMQLWARSWGDVAWACGAVPDQTARAAKAAARMRYVVTEFARDCYQELLDVERMLAGLPGYDDARLVRSSGVVSRGAPLSDPKEPAAADSRLDCA